uniref:Uncharacterized protein n=1 Tax=Candidatus Kentrum sp. FW TaxID=2126338 RepID=A0A450SSQ4_9GAMM|nr:MAG: hypothetical protein BECKFW1821B_GA0114236_100547 [Candidatus Kentron sp. FW]VFJ57010.1 MAG: hypothetical protein BECKFW1821A_GA0114235_106613 [Candidatus Kentron sp. FW]
MEIHVVARARAAIVVPARRDGGENKDCSELYGAFRPRRNAAGRNSGAAAVDCEFPNSFLVPGWIITLVSGTVRCIKKAPAHQKGSFDRRFGSSDRIW